MTEDEKVIMITAICGCVIIVVLLAILVSCSGCQQVESTPAGPVSLQTEADRDAVIACWDPPTTGTEVYHYWGEIEYGDGLVIQTVTPINCFNFKVEPGMRLRCRFRGVDAEGHIGVWSDWSDWHQVPGSRPDDTNIGRPVW